MHEIVLGVCFLLYMSVQVFMVNFLNIFSISIKVSRASRPRFGGKMPATHSRKVRGDLTPKTAMMQLIAPGAITAKNTLGQPDNIKVIPASAILEDHTVKFNIPPLSVGIVKLMQ